MKVSMLAILFGVLVSLPLVAAEDDPDADTGNAQTEQPVVSADDNTDTTADDSTQETDDTGLTVPSSDEDFVPSVRITEDLPVAFPVDI